MAAKTLWDFSGVGQKTPIPHYTDTPILYNQASIDGISADGVRAARDTRALNPKVKARNDPVGEF